MCTVSFVHKNGKTILTHNRDEQVARQSAIEPKVYQINQKNIYFPKDQKAGGTWFAVSEVGTILVLLNGADEKHQQKSTYRKSRGLIVLDIISAKSPIDEWNFIDLSEIEPFTIVLFQESKLYQLRWNEIEKSTLELDISKTYIWSSSTLYSKEIREKRTQLFDEFIGQNSEVNENDLLDFHSQTNEVDEENSFVMNRKDFLKTLSITQTVIEKNKVVLSYQDLQTHKNYTQQFNI